MTGVVIFPEVVVLSFSGKAISSLTFSEVPCGTTGVVIFPELVSGKFSAELSFVISSEVPCGMTGVVILPFVCANTGTPIIEIKIIPIVDGRINIPGSIVGINTIRYIKCNLRTNKMRSVI